jgi:N-acetylneuraminic acid mutarotase
MWLFGGEGYNESGTYGLLNDLWVFNVTTKVWTWISGNKTLNVQGIYGTKGVPNIANYPGSRAGSVSWVGLQGNLWVFGGIGYATGSLIGYLNDLWMFNITTKVWVWVSGNNTRDAYGKYGTKGVPNAANYPGGRQDAMSWADPQKNLWLFGGKGVAGSGGGGYLNDLWMFNVTTKIWVWVSGNNTINAYGKYGTKGVPDVGNYPGAQHLAILWGDVQDNLWLFGGQGYTWFPFGNLNDLLMFNSTTKLWTWILGNQLVDDHGIYGTKGVLDDGIYPCGRSGAVSWKDSQGNFWFFGGFGYPTMISGGYLNDLWKYTF